MVSKDFTINQHYLEYLHAIGKEYDWSQISCYSLQRRIRGLKTKIDSSQKPKVDKSNILVSTTNTNFYTRSKIAYGVEGINLIDVAFKNLSSASHFESYLFEQKLANIFETSTEDIEFTTKYVNSIFLIEGAFYCSFLKPGSRKMRT
ncbi:hypothetical protein A0J61_05805 [Choanephora cucurbitarum]|uniref:Uncharacterized protein n=1 Tax=Choanephora cucurbitarum TaxID=101091 RepID=A0A1C7NAQ7_9FUNG|nr:hypothetical protein A0J61_05805 [Choanephora cucurbitarum]